MKYIYSIRVFFGCLVILFLSLTLNAQEAPSDENPKHLAEDLWESIDMIAMRKQIMAKTQISQDDIELFMKFLMYKYPDERPDFFKQVEFGTITQTNIGQYVDAMTQRYINTYPEFLKQKSAFAIKQSASPNMPLAINGPCENVDFESGTTAGWQGFTGNACQNVIPCNLVNNFVPTRHTIMDATMVDPYIPTLPVVAPGGNFSMRLENYVNGGNATMIQQTFMVTPTNNIFTYQYAAVLEDPGNHGDYERPYFRVRMYDKNGKEIPCATYTAIAKPPIQNFTYSKVLNPNYNPNDNNTNNDNEYLNLYYRDWTTVSIPLLGLEGQNITIQFIASDCSRGGHLGYAYVDAKCSFLDTKIPPTICGAEDVTLYGPDDFAAYQWTGPGIVGPSNTQNITANKSGKYTLKLTPVADNPCPITVSTSIPERCVPVPISDHLCESLKGTQIRNNINLTSYNTKITAYNALAQVVSWHSAKPASNANKIANPGKVNVANGSKFYAVIKYTTLGSDTAEIDFTVNTLPVIQFPIVSPLCEGGAAVNISSLVAPAGGVFKGANITSAGVLTPVAGGTYPLKYIYTNALGCVDSSTSSVIINKPPVLTVNPNPKICTTTSYVTLQATASNYSTVIWSGGNGVFSASNALTTKYTPSAAEMSAGGVNVSIEVDGKAPCANVSQNLQIEFVQPPTVNAGIDQDLCSNQAASISLAGNGTGALSFKWSGGTGTFTQPTSLNTVYHPTATEIEAGSVNLKMTSLSNAPCSAVSDDVVIRFHKLPAVDAGEDTIVCSGVSVTFTATGSTGDVFTWMDNNGTTLSAAQTVTVVANTDSMLIVQAVNSYGCSNKDTVEVDAFKPPVFALGGPFCITDGMTLNANPVIPDPAPELPVWKKDNTILPGENGYTLNVTDKGKYSITYTRGGCITTDVTDVFKNPVLVTPDAFKSCEQTTVSVTTTNIPNAYYVWQNNGVILPGNSNTVSINVVAGLNKYYISVTDANNCSAEDSFLVTGIPDPVLSLTDTSICGNKYFMLDGLPDNAGDLSAYPLSYEWKFNSAVVSTEPQIKIDKAGKYELQVSAENCKGNSEMNVQIHPFPVVTIPSVYKFCPESDGEVLLESSPAYAYLWGPGGETTQSIKVKSEGVYSITVTSDVNCSSTAKTTVRELCPPKLFVADAFSPNHDGTNDQFNTYGIHIGTFKLLIFNRWGEIIFESVDKDAYWDGIYKGEVMPIGVYPWVITYEGDSQEFKGPYKLEGSVTIVK